LVEAYQQGVGAVAELVFGVVVLQSKAVGGVKCAPGTELPCPKAIISMAPAVQAASAAF
jgi:hypothetical protein